jgi:hypothetical protein
MRNVALINQARWPALDSTATPSRMSFKTVSKSNGDSVKYEDASAKSGVFSAY